MKITGRHLVVTPGLKAHVEKRFERRARYDVTLSHLEVILNVSKLQHTAEVSVRCRGAGFRRKRRRRRCM